MQADTEWFDYLERDGFVFLPAIFTPSEVAILCRDAAKALAAPEAASSVLSGNGPPHGARNLLRIWPDVADLIRTPRLAEPLRSVLGPQGGIVRGLWFDKPAGSGWALPWHRDTTIAVRAHGQFGRFRKPTVKAGVPHVEAPVDLLSTMISARIHLDAMTDRNGPLRVVPGSHQVERGVPESNGITLHCEAGDVLLMRPLLLHASGHCAPDHDGRRRVIHLEFAPFATLSDGYAWQTFLPI